jgi:16S rRNA (cytidine1402-2'-O)-methyltransferase
VTAVLSAAGVPADRFVFEGFLPVKAGRRRARLEALAALERPVVVYESPHRTRATLAAIGEVFGEVEVVLAREVTKHFEEFRRGTPATLAALVPAGGLRGEVTLVVNPRGPRAADDPAGDEPAPGEAPA